MKDQTESVNAKKLPYLLSLAAIEDDKRDNTLTIVRGVLDLDNGKISDNLLTLSLAELIKSKSDSKNAPKTAANSPEKSEDATPEREMSEKTRRNAPKSQSGQKVVNVSSETPNAVKAEISDKLPWETEMPSPKPEPINVVTPEELAERAKTTKGNLLNSEIEL